MKKILIILIISFSFQSLIAQKRTCYIRMLEFDSKYQIKEIDCATFDSMHDGIVTKEELAEGKQYKAKLAEYQKKLIELGYNFIPDGKISKKFIIAHHKYLRKKKKAERKAKKKKSHN